MSTDPDMNAILGFMPPFAETMGITVDHLHNGLPVMAFDYGPRVVGRPGFLHGGAMSGLM